MVAGGHRGVSVHAGGAGALVKALYVVAGDADSIFQFFCGCKGIGKEHAKRSTVASAVF